MLNSNLLNQILTLIANLMMWFTIFTIFSDFS